MFSLEQISIIDLKLLLYRIVSVINNYCILLSIVHTFLH
jgi:hypothetical protein